MTPTITNKATPSEAVNDDKQKLEGRKVKEIPTQSQLISYIMKFLTLNWQVDSEGQCLSLISCLASLWIITRIRGSVLMPALTIWKKKTLWQWLHGMHHHLKKIIQPTHFSANT